MAEVVYLEDIPNTSVNPSSVLTDEELRAGGLTKVQAFVRSRASRNALRIKKYREKAKADGIKQVNVQASEPVREAIRAIASRTNKGEPLDAVLLSLAGSGQLQKQRSPDEERLIRIGRRVVSLTGWRKWLVQLAGVI